MRVVQELTHSRRDSLLDEAARLREESGKRLGYTTEYAQAGMKSLFLSHGGAIISMLTILGNSSASFNTEGVFWAFVWFGSGMFACLAAYFCAAAGQTYLMRDAYLDALQARSDAYELNERYDNPDNQKMGDRILEVAGFLALISLSLFIAGAFVALFAIT
ncbi:hypothetical protein ABC955_01270 [Citromicrobium bathyomarinum]